MLSPEIRYAFEKVYTDLSERISQLAPNYQVQDTYSQSEMGGGLTYDFSILDNKKSLGTVTLTLGGVEVKLSSSKFKDISATLKREFSSKKFKVKKDAYKEEYRTVNKEVFQKGEQLPSLKEITKLEPYLERLERALPFSAYLTYATIRDGWVSECMQQGLSEEDLTAVKTILEEFIKEKDPEILTLEERLRPRKKK